jgi:hypothetical protein
LVSDAYAGTRVLKSASELFAVIKKSLLRCSKYITRGAAMLSLMGAFQARAAPAKFAPRASSQPQDLQQHPETKQCAC